MINPYHSLSTNLPERLPAGRDALPTDAKRLQAWVDALPRANQQAYLGELGAALDRFHARQLDGFTRLEVMEVLRPPLLEAVNLLASRLQGSSFPLVGSKAETAAQLLQLHRQLALGYRMALVEACAPAGKVPFLRGGQVATAVVRAAYHHVRWLATSYFLYRAPDLDVWAQIYALAAFASSRGLENKAVEDAAERRAMTVALLQNQAVLMALANPYRFSQRELVELWSLCRDVAGLVEMTPQRFAAAGALVMVDMDLAPTFVSRAPDPDEGDVLWIDLRKLDTLIRGTLSRTGDAGEAVLRLARDYRLTVSVSMLERVLEGWSQDITRASPRLDGGYAMHTIVGLSGLHYQLAGQQDFDTFMREVRGVSAISLDRAAWAQSSADAAHASIATARIQDQSLGGYRLRWDAAQGVRARIGELVGLGLPAEGGPYDWMVGMVRWLRYDDGGMEAGIDLISRSAHAVGLRVLDAGGSTEAPIRAIGLEPLSGAEGDSGRFLMSAVHDLSAPQVEVARGNDRWGGVPVQGQSASNVYTCGPLRALRRSGDYLLVEADRV